MPCVGHVIQKQLSEGGSHEDENGLPRGAASLFGVPNTTAGLSVT